MTCVAGTAKCPGQLLLEGGEEGGQALQVGVSCLLEDAWSKLPEAAVRDLLCELCWRMDDQGLAGPTQGQVGG